MPQMSPLLWLNLYILFTITLVIIISMFFFSKIPQATSKPISITPLDKLTWKW